VRGKGTKLDEGCPKVRLSQDRLPIEPYGKGTMLGEGFPKVRLVQDRLPIEP
jgi:hypothetical protein